MNGIIIMKKAQDESMADSRNLCSATVPRGSGRTIKKAVSEDTAFEGMS